MEAYPSVAVLVPCLDEAPAIAGVVRDFRKALPGAAIVVCDNGSTDDTAAVARGAGAEVVVERRRGKGNAVRRLFADVEADLYVLVDGDGTYDAASAPRLIDELVEGGYDLVNGAREHTLPGAYRPGHEFGNRLFTGLVRMIFGAASNDMLSGYKVMTHRFVKSFPARSSGFEIETELLVHALELGIAVAECPTPYRSRVEGSSSKLRTIRDGWAIVRLIARLLKDERPFAFFSSLAFVCAALSTGLAVPIVVEFLETGLVPRLPTAVLSVGLMLSAGMAGFSGLILETVTHGRHEVKRLHFLALLAHRNRRTATPRPPSPALAPSPDLGASPTRDAGSDPAATPGGPACPPST